MRLLSIEGVKISRLAVQLGEREVENRSPSKDVIGFSTLRRAEASDSSASLQIAAAKKLEMDFSDFGAVIAVSFTQRDRMRSVSAQAQSALGMPEDIVATDLLAACSGYGYGLYFAATLVKATGKKVLLLDGDKQSDFLSLEDESTASVLADGATATVLEPDDSGAKWTFAFRTDGAKSAALTLENASPIKMDGFAVFRYVASDVASAIKTFLVETGGKADDFDAFLPHQANLFMIRQLARSLGFSPEKTLINSEKFGNTASASVPIALANSAERFRGRGARLLLSGFGAGLSLFVADIPFEANFWYNIK